ncbi:SDR family oxidoreductase [Myceligenerans pegani]|uniref:SDR family NAD(P)-dependent oxidoreductase n=1 Tax=Myceligenerans pegani TaxID=2776917 RepID=A0ABR9MVD2_9MICO|nr:SDR family NAD(P)-dependent oxidoreductase [Myceligenerans sp. TRM 65318]MBE1875352.1 SDR family NAD(P)-dependent oxidoreductase [Myceligenerans sp. TRM 65318]MBE3017623.1 SDR family NAD(P)-dependent oxidoreductase [Myceligenerans sp. TRM 65318]
MHTSGNTVFIAGATQGIGLALARRFQEAGNTVIIGGRRTEILERLAAEHGFETVTIDVTDPASIQTARDQVLAAHPELNVLVAMAGIMVAEDVTKPDFVEIAQRTVETNILGTVRLIAAFTEHLQARSESTIVTVSSGLAHTPLGITPSYNGSKAFIHLFSETIRLQLARSSVKVVELCAPAVRTELMPGGSQVEGFYPLEDYIEDTWAILSSQPDVTEVVIDRVKPLRYSEVEDRYAATVEMLNSHAH